MIESYFWPILHRDLTIEIQRDWRTPPETILDAETIKGDLESGRFDGLDRELADTIRIAADVADGHEIGSIHLMPSAPSRVRAPRWEDVQPSDVELEKLIGASRIGDTFKVSLNVPIQTVTGADVMPQLTVYGRRVTYPVSRPSYFVRGGISIPKACSKNPTDFVFLVHPVGDELSTMLKSAENPSHAEFINTPELKQAYKRGNPTIAFVTGAPGAIARWLEQGQTEEDEGLFSDVFYAVTASQPKTRIRRTRRRNKVPVIRAKAKPKRYTFTSQQSGFVVRDLQNDAPLPFYIDIRLAYDADVHDPFQEHARWDFNLATLEDTELSVQENGCLVERLGPNHLRLVDLEDGFSVRLDGFDPNRDLKVRARATVE